MGRGIPKGSQAGTVESKNLDSSVKNISIAMAHAQSRYYYEEGHYNYKANQSAEVKAAGAIPELKELGIESGCVPDGGMWFDGDRSKTDRKLIAVFEAKHQQDHGNAQERWAKNYTFCKVMNPNLQYVTFMTGAGATVPTGVLYKFSKSMIACEGNRCIFYCEPTGFTNEAIFNIMNSILKLDLTYDQIKPFIGMKKPKKANNYATLFEDSADTKRNETIKFERTQKELELNNFAKNPEDPLYPVWHRLSLDNKEKAHPTVLTMLEAGTGNVEIATSLVKSYLK